MLFECNRRFDADLYNKATGNKQGRHTTVFRKHDIKGSHEEISFHQLVLGVGVK
jgi:hypothetical protein